MEVLILLAAIAVLVVWYFAALEFRRIAEMKGYDEPKYFWWTFLAGPIGMMMVIALPQKTETPDASAPVISDELPEI